MNFPLFISCPKGLEYLLESEVRHLGLTITKVNPQGVFGEGTLETIYRLALWSRLANRIQLILFSKTATDVHSIHGACLNYDWSQIMDADKTLAVEFHGSSETIRNTMFGGQTVKDGIVDYFRKNNSVRPSVDKDNPEIRIHAHLAKNILTLSLDLVGYSLHQRGYRLHAGVAPIRENIAAAMLVRAGWSELANEGFHLHDPFCGAGTLVIEAAMMAADRAPGLLRIDQAFRFWKQHDPLLWEKIRQEASERAKSISIQLTGTDLDPKAIEMALLNAENAGVSDLIHFKKQDLQEIQPSAQNGLIITNPPYGERLGNETDLIPTYQALGMTMHTHFQGWKAAILTSSSFLARAIGLRSTKQYTLFNGPLECKLYCFSLSSDNILKDSQQTSLSSGAQMFANRLRKNHEHLKKWAKRQNIHCYRIYDADLPEYSAAIDIYNDHVVLQEYAPPADIDAHKAEKRRLEMIQVLPEVLGIAPKHVVIKERKRQRGDSQYDKMDSRARRMVVMEGKVQLLVNLYDYLDTGLFLDHRIMRLRFADLKPNTRFLNCFCYTASASVHAAMAGAITTNVDMSNTYLSWAEDNFRQNRIALSKHQFIQYDCLTWLQKTRDHFDVIFLDPPSFSNSKRMSDTLDIQRDHRSLIESAMRLLNPGGILYFSTNLRHFRLDPVLMEKYSIKDISIQTIDLDFRQKIAVNAGDSENPQERQIKKIHQCFLISV